MSLPVKRNVTLSIILGMTLFVVLVSLLAFFLAVFRGITDRIEIEISRSGEQILYDETVSVVQSLEDTIISRVQGLYALDTTIPAITPAARTTSSVTSTSMIQTYCDMLTQTVEEVYTDVGAFLVLSESGNTCGEEALAKYLSYHGDETGIPVVSKDGQAVSVFSSEKKGYIYVVSKTVREGNIVRAVAYELDIAPVLSVVAKPVTNIGAAIALVDASGMPVLTVVNDHIPTTEIPKYERRFIQADQGRVAQAVLKRFREGAVGYIDGTSDDGSLYFIHSPIGTSIGSNSLTLVTLIDRELFFERFESLFQEMESNTIFGVVLISLTIFALFVYLYSMNTILERRVEEQTSAIEETNTMLEKEISHVREQKKKLMHQMHETVKFQQAVEEATDAVLITSSDQKIVYVNDAWEEMTGYTFADVKGTSPSSFLSKETSARLKKKLTRAFEKRRKFMSDDVVIARKNGDTFCASLSMFPVVEKDTVLYYVELMRDITDRKRADEAKNDFISIASHQLRTPLSTIRWYVEALLDGDAGKLLDPAELTLVHEIETGTKRMIRLVNDLLNISRLEVGRLKIDPQQTTLSSFVRGVVEEMEVYGKTYNVTVKLTIKKGVKGKVAIDTVLLREVLSSLLTNAIKYSKEGGDAVVHLIVEKTAKEIVLSVVDNGIGIPAAEQEKIFEKFYRASNAEAAESGGSGLGLYLAYMIMHSAGGSLTFESTEGEGTTFFATFPASGMHEQKGDREWISRDQT